MTERGGRGDVAAAPMSPMSLRMRSFRAIRHSDRLRVLAGFSALVLTIMLLALELATGFATQTGHIHSILDLIQAVAIFVSPAVFSLMGFLIIARRPRNTVGWMLCAVGLAFVTGMVLTDFPQYLYRIRHDHGPLMLALAVMGNAIWGIFTTCLGVLLLLFPTGHPPSPRWGWVLRVGLVASAVSVPLLLTAHGKLGFVPVDNPIGLPFISSDIGFPVLLASIFLLPAGLASLGHRFWTSRGDERQQLKWLTYSASFAVLFYLLALGESGFSQIMTALYAFAISAVPVSIGIGILKYRLYDIDVLINRTLVYGVLTATLAGFYLGSIVLLQALSRSVTSQSSDLAVVVSTLAIAALFSPWRRRLQAFIDHRFYRHKYDAAQTLAALQTKLRDEVDLDHLTAEVQDTVEPRHIALWLKPELVP